jgi:uncharacterized membrane protein
MLFDNLLGATLQRRGRIGNSRVNLLTPLSPALLGILSGIALV